MSGFREVVLLEGGKWPIPFSNNLELPEDERVYIHFNYLSKKQIEQARANVKPSVRVTDGDAVEVKELASTFEKEAAKLAITKIDPFPVNYKGNSIKIDSYEQLNSVEGLENILFKFENWFKKQEAFDSKKSE